MTVDVSHNLFSCPLPTWCNEDDGNGECAPCYAPSATPSRTPTRSETPSPTHNSYGYSSSSSTGPYRYSSTSTPNVYWYSSSPTPYYCSWCTPSPSPWPEYNDGHPILWTFLVIVFILVALLCCTIFFRAISKKPTPLAMESIVSDPLPSGSGPQVDRHYGSVQRSGAFLPPPPEGYNA